MRCKIFLVKYNSVCMSKVGVYWTQNSQVMMETIQNKGFLPVYYVEHTQKNLLI